MTNPVTAPRSINFYFIIFIDLMLFMLFYFRIYTLVVRLQHSIFQVAHLVAARLHSENTFYLCEMQSKKTSFKFQ